jgi:hypothetical protein
MNLLVKLSHQLVLLKKRNRVIIFGLMKFSDSIFSRFLNLYTDGFRNMSLWGKKVWIIILIKLFIMFAILKIFFFPDFLKKSFDNDKQRSEYVLDQLINSPNNHD